MPHLKNFGELEAIVADIKLANGWTVEVLDYTPYPGWQDEQTGPRIWLLRVRCDDDRCNDSGEPMVWTGRKWFISRHSTVSEVVQTALKAVLTAAEHELREQFTYQGVRVFDPHMDLPQVVERSVRPPIFHHQV